MKQFATAGAAALALALSAPVLAQDAAQGDAMPRYDTDQDERVSTDEFRTQWDAGGGFEGWDADESGALSREEAGDMADRGGFDEWDADTDDQISEDEFSQGVFAQYDEDGDGYLDADELSAYLDDVDAGAWDSETM